MKKRGDFFARSKAETFLHHRFEKKEIYILLYVGELSSFV
jgi:hypothetical protein